MIMRGLVCLAVILVGVLVFSYAQQTKKKRVIPDEFTIEIGDVPRWMYRHAYNVSINGRLLTDTERVPSVLHFNRTMLPADLYEQVYLQTRIMPKPQKPKPDRIDPLNLTFDERRWVEWDELFGTERPYAWIQRGWNYTCEVCQKQFAVDSDYYLHLSMHYVTNYSATPIMNWSIIDQQDRDYKNKCQSYWIDYWLKVSKGLIHPEYDTDVITTTPHILEQPIICYICNATITNSSHYEPHMDAHREWEEWKYGNLTAKYARPTKTFEDIQYRKLYVADSLNTQEEDEYAEAQRIVKEASHFLNTDELMDRTKNLSIHKRLLEFGIDSRGRTLTWPRIKLMPEMSLLNDSESCGGPQTLFDDPEMNAYEEQKRRKWEEEYLRRRKAQEKGNPDFATYSIESNETAIERRRLNITRRRRKYTPKLIYIRRKRRDVEVTTRKHKSTTDIKCKLIGKMKLRRANKNKRKTKEQVYKQQLQKIIQKAKAYLLKFNKTHYPTTQSIYEKVQIYKVKEKFKRLNWFLHGLDNYTVPPDIDIDMITNTPYTTVRPLFYKRVEKRDLYMRQFMDFKRHKRHIDELKTLIHEADEINQEMQAEDDANVEDKRKKRHVNFEDINLQEIENALKPLATETAGTKIVQNNEETIVNEKKNLDDQKANYKRLLFKREVHENLLNEHIAGNANPKNPFGRNEMKELEETKVKLMKKRDLAEKTSIEDYAKPKKESVEFDASEGKRNRRNVDNVHAIEANLESDLNFIKKTFNTIVKANKEHRNKRQVDAEQCEFYKNLLDEKNAVDEEELKMIRDAKQSIEKGKEAARNERNKEAAMQPKGAEQGESNIEVQHFNHQPNGKEAFLLKKIQNNPMPNRHKKVERSLNNIRNKRSPHVHGPDEHRCHQINLKRMKREPRFRKDRLPTKKKRRTTCPFFARTRYMYNCTVCNIIYSLEGALAQHNYKKHNGSALIVSYDTKDIEDEYYSWDYENIPKNDTVETTREKWEKRCLVPNQKRHRYLNKGCTPKYRHNQGGAEGGEGGEQDNLLRRKRAVGDDEEQNVFDQERNVVDEELTVKRIQKRNVQDPEEFEERNLKRVQKRNVNDVQEPNVVDKRVQKSNVHGPIRRRRGVMDVRGRRSVDQIIRDKGIRIEDSEGNPITLSPFIKQQLEGRCEARREGRIKRDVVISELTDELDSVVRDPNRKYQWTNDKSWEWRIKNVNIRDLMYRIMEKRMMTTSTPHPDAVIYDYRDVEKQAIKYTLDEVEDRNRRVSAFYADNGYFSGRTGSDLEIYADSNPHLPEIKQVGPARDYFHEEDMFKPKPDLFKNRHLRYTNVKPGSRTTIDKSKTSHYPNPFEFTDKKDYYDSDIEVAKSQFRFRRDINGDNRGQYSMVRSHDRRKREIEYDTDYSSNLARFECIDTHPELFDRLYPNVSVYTPYTLYPTTQSWMTQGTLDPTATYPWVEKSGPDSGDVNEWDANLDPLEKSVKDFFESEQVSREMAKQTEIDPVEYQEWLDWQRNRSLEDENQYENITYTCRMPGCTFNHSDDIEVGDHIFIHHFTYPTNYKEEMTYRIESSTLGWERLTDVNYLLNRYSDEALHPDIREDFDIFTGLFDNLNFPTIHPNHTLPSKKKRTKFVPTTDPLMETIPITKPKKTTNHHEHAEKHGHHTAKGDHHTGKHDHHSTKHDHLADAGDGHHKRHRRDLGVGHKRQRRDYDSLPPMPKDSNERSGPDGRRYYPSPESHERRHRRALKADEALHAGHHKRHRRDYDSLPPMPKDSNERSGPDGRRYYPSPESRERRHHRDYDSLPSKPKDSNERSGPSGRRYYPSPESRERRHHRDYDSLPSKAKDSNERSGPDGRRYYPSPESRERHRRDLDSIPPLPSPSTNELLDSYGGPAFLKTGEELSDLTPAPTGTTVFDLLPLYSNYEPEKETRWKFSEETVPPKFRCKYCGDLFHEEDHLIHHKSSVHPRLRTPTTTPKFRIMKNFFTLDSEVDMSKNYDFVFSEPDNGSFVQHRPILEDSFYKSFNPDAPEHNVNPESYAAIDEYMDEVFNKSTHSICNACGKNISHRSAEAHFRKHVSRIKKDYFDELPPEYMDRCFKEAYWDDSWETIHHKLRRQYEENRIVQSIFEPETYKCKRCNATFRNHELTYAHLLEHKKNASIISAREAEIRNQIKRDRARNATTLPPHQKEWNPDYIDYLKGVKHKRSVDCIEIDNPGAGDNKTVPLYKIYESFNTSKERIENITPGRIPNIFTVDIPKESIGKSNSDAKNLNKVVDDYNERSISENLESRVQERYARQKETDTEIDQQTVSKSGIGEEDPEKVSQNTNGVNKDTNGVNKDMDGANKDINGVNNDMNPPPEAHEEIPEIPDYYLNVNEDNEEDNHSEEEESDSDSDSSDEDRDGRKTTRNFKSGQDGSSLENFIAKVKREFNTITTQDILGNQSILLTRIEKMFADNQRHRKAFFRRFRRQVEVTDDDEIDRRVLAERWNSTECNIVEKLEKRFSTKLVDKGHKFLETDVSRLLEDFGIAKNPNVTSEENRMRERSFRECMRIIDARETRSDQNYHVQYDEHMDYMRLRNETATLSPSEEVMWRSKPRNEYSDYEELMSDKWTCYECNKTYDNYTAFLMHMKKPKEPKSPYLIELENKERKERIENIFTTKSYWVNECFECGAKFNTRQELLDHINDKGYESLPHIDRVDQTVKCVHCDLAFTNVQKYLEHKAALREAEILLGNQTNKVFCGDCKKYFDTYDDYHDHLNRERITDYEEMPKYICPVCNFTYLDSISLGLHMKKIHPEEDAKRVRKRRSCRIENAETVHVVAHHLDYNVMKHFVLDTVNKGRRKKRNVEYKKKQKRSRRKKRDLMMLKRNKAVRNNKREGMEHSIKKRQVNVENTHNGNKNNIKKRQVNIGNKHNLLKQQIDTEKKIDNEVNKPRREIINKRKRRDVDTLMDKMDKEYEKYHMFNWNPDFNIKDPILMHDKYREYYFQGLAEHEKHNLQLQNDQAQRDLIGSQAGQELMAPGDKELRGPGQNLEGVEGTYAYGPALFGTTWSYKLWPTIRYNIMAPGKSYNNTQYFHRYYQNQTIKNHIKAIFRDYFIKPLNATWPVRQFRESERDTEELESLARKDRRKRTAEDVSDEGIEKDLDDNDDVENENQIGENRNKRHVVDRACFYDQIRERPKIAKKIDKKCGCKNKFNEAQAPLETHIEIKANDIININNIAKGDNELVNEGESINNANGDNIVDTVHIAKRSNIAQGDNFIDPDNKGEAIHIANGDNIVDTVHNTKRNNIAVNNIPNENIVNPNNGGSVNIAIENIVHANLGDVEMKKVRVRSPKPTSPKPPRPKRTKPDEYDDVEDINKEVTILDAALLPESPVAQPAVACGCHAPRVRRQLRIDVNNNNTIHKVNWEKLAKILVHENRNLSKLLDRYVTRRTTPIRKYECRHCGERLPDLQPYLEHMVQHEKEFELEQSYSEEFNITCNHCYQIFSTEDAIHEHNLERMRILREREHADYVELNRTTRRKIYTPFEDPFTIKIMENEDNTFWNPPEVTETEDPAEDRYYCYYCKDMMANTKEFIEHRKFHETSRKQAKEAYLARREKIKEKAKKDFSLESLADM